MLKHIKIRKFTIINIFLMSLYVMLNVLSGGKVIDEVMALNTGTSKAFVEKFVPISIVVTCLISLWLNYNVLKVIIKITGKSDEDTKLATRFYVSNTLVMLITILFGIQNYSFKSLLVTMLMSISTYCYHYLSRRSITREIRAYILFFLIQMMFDLCVRVVM